MRGFPKHFEKRTAATRYKLTGGALCIASLTMTSVSAHLSRIGVVAVSLLAFFLALEGLYLGAYIIPHKIDPSWGRGWGFARWLLVSSVIFLLVALFNSAHP